MIGLVICAGLAHGQDGVKVPITFLPPPLENATYSVGIYDKKHHHAVRQLCMAAPESAFTVGLNGLITSWDGKDGSGKPVPPGRYSVWGLAVGAVKITGKEIIGNEWLQQDALPVRTVEALAWIPEDEGVALVAQFEAGCELLRYAGTDGHLLWHVSIEHLMARGAGPSFPSCTLEVKDGVLVGEFEGGMKQSFGIADGKALDRPTMTPRDAEPQAPAFPRQSGGKDGTTWKIRDDGIYQLSPTGEVLRYLGIKPGEPAPVAVIASPKSDRLFLIEDSPEWPRNAPDTGWQRVRGLLWVETKEEGGQPVSTWQTFFERNLHFPDPELSGYGVMPDIDVDAVANPLSPGKDTKIGLRIKFDAAGTYLVTEDGLRLRQISQQQEVKSARLKRETADSISVLQLGRTAWEVFSIEGLKNMMMFDAGTIEMTADGEKKPPEKTAEPPDL